jgi:biotin transporter BioY
MFEKTKLIMTLVFTICFLAYSFLIGKFYEKFHMSRTAWMIICAILTAGVVAAFIADILFQKKSHGKDLVK